MSALFSRTIERQPADRERRRLLYVFPQALYAGQHFAHLVRAAGERFEVHIAVPPAPVLDGFDLGEAVLHDMPVRRGMPAPLAEIGYARRLRFLIRRLRPDILHAVTIRPVIYGGIVGRRAVPAAVFSVTGLGYLFGEARAARFLRPAGEIAYRRALGHPRSATVFENHDDRDLFVARRLVSPERSRVFLGVGVDLGTFAFAPEPLADRPIVVLPSRLIAEKGVREFAEAARLLRLNGVSARFVLVGDVDFGNPTSLQRDEIDTWVRAGDVEWWGWREDMAGTLQRSAIVCLPSYYREGAPRSLIEAAAVGRPAVTTDMPGCRDVVADGETGLIVPPRDAPALAAALGRLLADRSLRVRMGMTARVRAESLFSTGIATQRILELYEELAPRQGGDQDALAESLSPVLPVSGG